MNKKILTCAAIAVAALAQAPPALAAGSSSGTFDVTATVVATCSLSAQNLLFGNYNPITAANTDAATTMSVTCTNGTPYQVGISLGGGTGATTATRYMVLSTNKLGYTLYRDSNRTQLWGTTANTDTLSGTGTGTAATVNVYGRIAMQQAVPAGDYQDTVTVTVTW